MSHRTNTSTALYSEWNETIISQIGMNVTVCGSGVPSGMDVISLSQNECYLLHEMNMILQLA